VSVHVAWADNVVVGGGAVVVVGGGGGVVVDATVAWRVPVDLVVVFVEVEFAVDERPPITTIAVIATAAMAMIAASTIAVLPSIGGRLP